jgi:alpha-tubulin suppressor-like RCC1 family protein
VRRANRVTASTGVAVLIGLTSGPAVAQNAPFPAPTVLWAAQTSPTEITLSWRQVPGAVLYQLYAIAGGDARPVGRIQRSGNRAVQRVDGFGVPHVFAIEAISENGTISERVRFNEVIPVQRTPGPIAAPTSVVAEAEGNGIVAVRWAPVPGATAYMIGRAVAPGGYRMICSLCRSTPVYLDSATTPGATHAYTIVALTPSGPSRPGRSGSVIPQGALTAATPAPPNAVPVAPKGTIRATPRPGSCLALGSEGNFIVRLADGSVRIYERIQYRRRGPSHPTEPKLEPVPDISDAVGIATSGEHWLVLRSDGTILSWGSDNSLGRLGGNRAAERRLETPTSPSMDRPAPVRDITNAIAVAAGADHSVALLEDGTIRTWGSGSHGIPGDGSPAPTNRLAPTRVVGIENAVAVAATGSASFALLADGTIRSWGWNRMAGNTFGVLGIGRDDEESNVPLPVAGISNATGIAAGGGGSAAAVLADGSVRAWGFGYGMMPKRGLPASNTPLPMDGIRDAVAISPHLALLRDGTVREFGARDWPWATPKLSGVVAVASDHVNRFALLTDGRLMAWGHKQWYPNGAVVRAELGAETARQCGARGLGRS